MAAKTELQRSILAKAYADPDLSQREIASVLDCSPSYVSEVLNGHDEGDFDGRVTSTEWTAADRCPFCGDDIPDGGPGFMEHIAERSECKVAFERWREQVDDDVGGEWIG